MRKAIVRYISSKEDFPIPSWKNHKVNLDFQSLPLSQFSNILLSSDLVNILFFSVSELEWRNQHKEIMRFDTDPNCHLLIVHGKDFAISHEPESNFLVLENPIQPKVVRLLIDKTIQAELYKIASIEIGNSCLSNIGYFEGLFELARQENQEKTETVKAMEKILEYESKMKISQMQLNQAIENMNQMRERELLELHERIKATERLDALREKELKEVLKQNAANEAALQFSREEELNMDKIIKAQNRIFEFTDKEIRDLFEENKELKRRLGLPEDKPLSN